MSPRNPVPQTEQLERNDDRSKILLFMHSGRDRELLVETLNDRYHVETTTKVETIDTTFDCCIFDYSEFNRVAGTVQSRRETSNPLFLPFVLLIGSQSDPPSSPELWEYVDDIMELPVEKAGLLSRIGNLIERRRTAVRLARREARLQATVEDLKLKERAMDEAPVGITIAEAGEEDDPLVYLNDRFETLTGYTEEVIGKDCRFLQGQETDQGTKRALREAIDAGQPISVDITNYRRNGQKFWSKVDIAPVYEDSSVTHYVGFQTDITARKIRERQLEVLNRVLSHNLRNKMNIIEGHAGILREQIEEEEILASLRTIEETAADLHSLGDSVRDVQRTLSGVIFRQSPINLHEQLRALISSFRDRYPNAKIELVLPNEELDSINVPGLITAIREAVDNAVKHNPRSSPVVKIRVTLRSEEWIDIEIEDNGPGIPDREIEVLDEGETSVHHADRLGIWLMYWIVSLAGGMLDVSNAEPEGTILTLSVPKESWHSV